MNSNYPRVRIRTIDNWLLAREALSINFYMRHLHAEVASGLMRSLERYRSEVGSYVLSHYSEEGGGWEELDDTGWAALRGEVLAPICGSIDLRETASREKRYRFDYRCSIAGPPYYEPNSVGAVSFWLPTEYLEAHGPEKVREFALELAAPLPFCSGHAGLAFNCDMDVVGIGREVTKRCFQYPGMDIPDIGHLSMCLGAKLRTVSWLTFLGQPVLGEVGGAAGLRARLRSPDITVQELGGDRVVLTLGSRPEAGEEGRVPPLYREVARALEPWLFQDKYLSGSAFTEEELRRWERRLID